jgi:hypothetical protein
MQSQMCDEEKKKLTGYVIFNDGETPLIPQVESLLEVSLSLNTINHKTIDALC